MVWVFLLARLTSGPVLASGIQKWTDANGRVHYGDEPPPGMAAKRIATASGGEVSPDSEVQVSESVIRTFDVSGTTAEELNASVRANGPVASDGKRRWGTTRWNLGWKDYHVIDGGTCRIDTFTVTLDTTMNLPNWTDRNAAPYGLKSKWDRFAERLRVHEDGHRQNGIRAANEFANNLRTLTPAQDCAALERDISVLFERIKSEYRFIDEGYDRATNHGRSQGATLF